MKMKMKSKTEMDNNVNGDATSSKIASRNSEENTGAINPKKKRNEGDDCDKVSDRSDGCCW